jgi:hypothetical protein
MKTTTQKAQKNPQQAPQTLPQQHLTQLLHGTLDLPLLTEDELGQLGVALVEDWAEFEYERSMYEEREAAEAELRLLRAQAALTKEERLRLQVGAHPDVCVITRADLCPSSLNDVDPQELHRTRNVEEAGAIVHWLPKYVIHPDDDYTVIRGTNLPPEPTVWQDFDDDDLPF